MLVLSLNPHDDVYIGDNIRIIYKYKFPDGRIQLAFDAPKDIKILRGKLKRMPKPETPQNTSDSTPCNESTNS